MKENKQIELYGEHLFAILRVLTKMGIKDEMGKLFKDIVKLGDKEITLKNRLNIALEGKEPTEENIREILEKDVKLAKEYSEHQGNNIEKSTAILSLIIEKMPNAEKEIQALLGNIFVKSTNEMKKVKLSDEINMIKQVIECEEIKTAFSMFFK